MPRRFGQATGLIIGATYSTDDWEQLDQTEIPGDPVKYKYVTGYRVGALCRGGGREGGSEGGPPGGGMYALLDSSSAIDAADCALLHTRSPLVLSHLLCASCRNACNNYIDVPLPK